jgi:hypothetical protein
MFLLLSAFVLYGSYGGSLYSGTEPLVGSEPPKTYAPVVLSAKNLVP